MNKLEKLEESRSVKMQEYNDKLENCLKGVMEKYGKPRGKITINDKL